MGYSWPESPQKIAIFRALKLGDMLCAVPTFRAIRSRFSKAKIVLVGLPWSYELFLRYRHYLDALYEFPGYPGLPERNPDLDRLSSFFQSLQAERFDLAIQLHGSGSISNVVTAQFGAKVNAGYYEPDQSCPDPSTFFLYPNHGLEIRRLLGLVENLGIPSQGEFLEFPIFDEERDLVRRLAISNGMNSRNFICIHGGASVPERRWPAAKFAIVADALAARGYAVVLTGATQEVELATEIARAMRSPAIDLVGKTPLGTLAALLSTSRLLVCNDTGVSHLADALRVPSVVISTGDNPERWAPIDRSLHRVLCRDSGVEVSEVLVEANALLSESTNLAALDRRPGVGHAEASEEHSARSSRKTCDLYAS